MRRARAALGRWAGFLVREMRTLRGGRVCSVENVRFRELGGAYAVPGRHREVGGVCGAGQGNAERWVRSGARVYTLLLAARPPVGLANTRFNKDPIFRESKAPNA